MNQSQQTINENANEVVAQKINVADVAKYERTVTMSRELHAFLKLCVASHIDDGATIRTMFDMIGNKPRWDARTFPTIKEGDFTQMMKLLHAFAKTTNDLRMLPYFQTDDEREDAMNDKVDITDFALDFTSSRGRNEIVRKYAPLVSKLVNYYAQRVPVGRDELQSAALTGLAIAINDFDKNYGQLTRDEIDALDDEERAMLSSNKKKMQFKGYAYMKIKTQILRDVNEITKIVKTPYYAKGGEAPSSFGTTSSVDKFDNVEETDRAWAYLLGSDNERMMTSMSGRNASREQRIWDELFDALSKKFSVRDCEVFRALFAIGGEKQLSGRELAHKYNVSDQMINIIKTKIIKYIRSNKVLSDKLSDLFDMYKESLMYDAYVALYDSRENNDLQTSLHEYMMNDDTYVMIESLTRFENKSQFMRAFKFAMNQLNIDEQRIVNALMKRDERDLYAMNENEMCACVHLLDYVYPDKCVETRNDIIDEMCDVRMYHNKFNS